MEERKQHLILIIDEIESIFGKYNRQVERMQIFREAMQRYCESMRSDLPILRSNEFEFIALCAQCGEEHRFRQSIEVV